MYTEVCSCLTFGVMQFFHFEQYSKITKHRKLFPTYACYFFLPALLQLSWECNINRKKCSLTSVLFVEDSVNVQLEGSEVIFVLMSTSQIKLPQANEPESNQSPKVLFSSQMVLNIFTTVKEVETKPYC